MYPRHRQPPPAIEPAMAQSLSLDPIERLDDPPPPPEPPAPAVDAAEHARATADLRRFSGSDTGLRALAHWVGGASASALNTLADRATALIRDADALIRQGAVLPPPADPSGAEHAQRILADADALRTAVWREIPRALAALSRDTFRAGGLAPSDTEWVENALALRDRLPLPPPNASGAATEPALPGESEKVRISLYLAHLAGRRSTSRPDVHAPAAARAPGAASSEILGGNGGQ
jgi:hypothetical protein